MRPVYTLKDIAQETDKFQLRSDITLLYKTHPYLQPQILKSIINRRTDLDKQEKEEYCAYVQEVMDSTNVIMEDDSDTLFIDIRV